MKILIILLLLVLVVRRAGMGGLFRVLSGVFFIKVVIPFACFCILAAVFLSKFF